MGWQRVARHGGTEEDRVPQGNGGLREPFSYGPLGEVMKRGRERGAVFVIEAEVQGIVEGCDSEYDIESQKGGAMTGNIASRQRVGETC